jgi:hypothetical protein
MGGTCGTTEESTSVVQLAGRTILNNKCSDIWRTLVNSVINLLFLDYLRTY